MRFARLLESRAGRLTPLLERVRLLQRVENLLRKILGADMAGHCRAGGIAGGRLVLLADSPVWATRIRYAVPALLEQLGDAGDVPVREIQVRVGRLGIARGKAPRRARPLGEETARNLRETAEAVGDEALRAALLRLARRRGRPES
ncbi:MAG: DUF721 domain-containing protein [Gammaproteobacteria bacterium]|nr:DUF721 domain-containing protein [Gammaproteobacteria bacterium]